MSKWTVVALATVLALPMSARAGDSKETKKEEKVKTSEKSKKSESSEDRGGFKGFWIHKIGAPLGNGLKGGADKISKAF